jgi:fumarylacetoacetase
LKEIENAGLFNKQLFSELGRKVFQGDVLNDFMALSRPYWREARETIQALFSENSNLQQDEVLKGKIVVASSEVINYLAVRIGDYTDFYSSRSHAFNVGSIIRGPNNALNENWVHIPIGYHGRSSSIVVSGTSLRRPRGQVKAKDATVPSFSECKRLDF